MAGDVKIKGKVCPLCGHDDFTNWMNNQKSCSGCLQIMREEDLKDEKKLKKGEKK